MQTKHTDSQTHPPEDDGVQLVTPNPAADEQLLYFTSSSVTSDDKSLTYLSNLERDVNAYTIDLGSGSVGGRSANSEGMLRSYVYYHGQPMRGLGIASLALHEGSGTLYYLQGRAVMKSELGKRPRKLAEYPAGQVTRFTHVSADGSRICVPTVDEKALEGCDHEDHEESFHVDARVRSLGLSSYLRVYDTQAGKEVVTEEVRGGWVTHVQFNPRDPSLILYNHEHTFQDCGIRRMWLFDGSTHRQLRTENDGRSRND